MSSAPRRMIAIGSGKGGVGKSFLALNLAWCFAELGRRVLLLELDSDAGALAVAAGLGEPKVLPPARDSAELASRVLTPPGAPRLQLLRASDLPPQHVKSTSALAPFLEQVSADLMIVDLAPGMSAQTVLWLSRAEHAVLVGTPELVCVQAMLRLNHQLRRQHTFLWLRRAEPRLQATAASLTAVRVSLEQLVGAERSQQLWSQALAAFAGPQWVFNRVLPDDNAQLSRIQAYLATQLRNPAFTAHEIPEEATQTRCARFGRVLMRHEPASAAASAIRKLADGWQGAWEQDLAAMLRKVG